MGREVVNIRSSDIVVIVGGRSGTLGELAIAYDEGKLIGVLKGTGGITNLIPKIINTCKKKTGAKVLYNSDPGKLLDALIQDYQLRHFKAPSCFSSRAQPLDFGKIRTKRDLVCGMWISPKIAKTVTFKGKRYFFCCHSCAKSFKSEPARYLTEG